MSKPEQVMRPYDPTTLHACTCTCPQTSKLSDTREQYNTSSNRHDVSIKIIPTVHSCTFFARGRSSSYLQLYGIPQDTPTHCVHTVEHILVHSRQVSPIRLLSSWSVRPSNLYVAQGQSHPHKSWAALFPVYRGHQIPGKGGGVATGHRYCTSLARYLCLPSSSLSHGLKMFHPMFV
jgi:hypothetical protein